MIGSLRGTLLDVNAKGEILVEVGGVGYRATVGSRTLSELGDLGSQVFVYVHTHVREDALVLYGFAERDERNCFEALLGAHGVGPALALAILSAHTPTSLRRALVDDDADALTVVAGVGKKTAARLLIELKNRLDVDAEVDLSGRMAAGDDPTHGSRSDVRLALAGLGYGPQEIGMVLRDLPAEGEVDQLLRQALSLLRTSA